MAQGWGSLGERKVDVRVAVPLEVEVKPKGSGWVARTWIGRMRLEVTAAERAAAVAGVERAAAVALGRALSAA